jgi:predicted DNA-binding transcriptional regulator YafY
MNRIDRLVAMVTHLQGRRVVKAEELSERFEISLRTVYRDVAALIESGVPICGEAGVGYSLMKGYHLPPVTLTAEEAMVLFIGGEMVKQFSDASMTKPMESALAKLRSVLPRERQDDLDRLSAAMMIFGDRRGAAMPDQRILLPIQQAIVALRILRFRYKARARDEESVRDVEPLGVTYHSGAWYLVAWCRLRKDYRYFKLERIQNLEVRSERFGKRTDFSLAEHLRKQRSTMKKIPVRVWFSAEAIERARRESYNELVAEKASEDGYEISLDAFSLDWMARWLLSFGDEAEALAPPVLRAKMAEVAANMQRQYQRAARSSSARKLDLMPVS